MHIPWDPHASSFPKRNDLPQIEGAPYGAAWVWGKDDNIGRLNLLTPARVAAAAKEIQDGDMVCLNLPLDVPKQPAFGREIFQHEIKVLAENIAYDDLYKLNTQSGTQLDGFRHFASIPTLQFYNNATGADFTGGKANLKCSIHYLAEHGICGRGVLLDYRSYAHKSGKSYDPYDYHAILFSDLVACGRDQGLDIRPEAQGGDIKIGDFILIRSGFVERYNETSLKENEAVGLREHRGGVDDGQRWAGLAQEEDMLDWLHDCYFAVVGGDAPTFEAWPSFEGYYLHEHLLALWGTPIGEMIDLEKLAETCRAKNRWTFFIASSPANVKGGVGSHLNATAIF